MHKNNLNVTLVIPNLCFGGAEKVCVNLSNELSLRHNVDLIIIGKDLSLLSQINDRVNVINLKSNKISLSFFKLFKFFLKKKNSNVISFLNHTNLICILLKFIFKFNLIITVHNVIKPPSLKKNYKDKLILILNKFFYKKADHVVACADYVRRDLKKIFNLPAKTIYNPVISKNIIYSSDFEKNFFLSTNNLKEKEYILNIGSFTEQKNHLFLLEFFKEVSLKYNKKFKLVLLGDGIKKNEIKEKIKRLSLEREVVLVGNVKNPENFIKYSLCFVLTSKWEGLPNVIIETMKYKKPIIASHCPGGINEVLPNGDLGFYINLEKQEFLDKFKKIVNSNNKFQDYTKVINNFTIQSQTAKYMQLFE